MFDRFVANARAGLAIDGLLVRMRISTVAGGGCPMSIWRLVIAGVLLSEAALTGCRGGSNVGGDGIISGVVSGPVAGGVKIDVAGPTSGATLTDAAGNYRVVKLEPGSYVVTPSLAGYSFTPPAMALELPGAAAVANFVGAKDTGCPPGAAVCTGPNKICGTVSGDIVANVTVFVSLPGGSTFSTLTDSEGRYSFSSLPDAQYLIGAFAGRGFTIPAEVPIQVTDSCLVQDFVVNEDTRPCAVDPSQCATTNMICGHINTASGSRVAGAQMSGFQNNAAEATGPLGSIPPTNSEGAYWFPGLMQNPPLGSPGFPGSDTITPTLAGYRFTPPTRTVTLAGSCVSDVDFIATPE